LKRLEELRSVFGASAAAEKRDLLELLNDDHLRSARQVHDLHEVLCFLRAYPDDAALLARVEEMLRTFAARADLAEHRDALEGTGIAGTAIPFPFFFSTARWLADRWPDRLAIDWTVEDHLDRLRAVLPALVSPTEAMAFRESRESARALVERMRGVDEADGTGLVRRFAALGGATSTVETVVPETAEPASLLSARPPESPARRPRYGGDPDRSGP
jgi:hypothetical protein